MQQCNENVENGVSDIVSQSIASSFDAKSFSALIISLQALNLCPLFFLLLKYKLHH